MLWKSLPSLRTGYKRRPCLSPSDFRKTELFCRDAETHFVGDRILLRVWLGRNTSSSAHGLLGSAARDRMAATQACPGKQGRVASRRFHVLHSPSWSTLSSHTATKAWVTPTGGACCPNVHTCFCLFRVAKGKVAVVAARFRQLSAAARVSRPLLATTAPLYASDKASCFLTGAFSHKMFCLHCKQSGWIQDSSGDSASNASRKQSLHKPKRTLTYVTGHRVSLSNPCQNITLLFCHSLLGGEASMQISLRREKRLETIIYCKNDTLKILKFTFCWSRVISKTNQTVHGKKKKNNLKKKIKRWQEVACKVFWTEIRDKFAKPSRPDVTAHASTDVSRTLKAE